MLIGINPGYFWDAPQPSEKHWTCQMPSTYTYYPRITLTYAILWDAGYTAQGTPQVVSSNNNVLEIGNIIRRTDALYTFDVILRGDGTCNVTIIADGFTEIKPITVTDSFIAYPFNDPLEEHVILTLLNFRRSSVSIGRVWRVGLTRTVLMDAWNYDWYDLLYPDPAYTNPRQTLTVRIEMIQSPSLKLYNTVSGELAQVIVSFTASGNHYSLKDIYCLRGPLGTGWRTSNVRRNLNDKFKNSLHTLLPIAKVYVDSFAPVTKSHEYVLDWFFLPASCEYSDYSNLDREYSQHDMHDGNLLQDSTLMYKYFMRTKNRRYRQQDAEYYLTRSAYSEPNYAGYYTQVVWGYYYEKSVSALGAIHANIQPLAALY